MPVVYDEKGLAASQEHARVVLGKHAERDDWNGRLARLGLATLGIDVWAFEEVKRGASLEEILETVMLRAASMVGTQIVNADITGNKRAIICAKLAQLTRQMAERVEESIPDFGGEPQPSHTN